MSNRLMVDLESLGTQPNSVITAIGAVRFDRKVVVDKFYCRVDWQSCVDAGLKMDVETVRWWMKQKDEAREEIVKDGLSLHDALAAFSLWTLAHLKKVDEVWGNGATFDNVLLTSAYSSMKISRPWGYSADRCYRTMKNLYPSIKAKPPTVAHNALDDAISQAEHLIEILKAIK